MSERLNDIRERNEARKAAEATGIIGGVRQDFDIDYLLCYIDRMGVQLGQAQDEVFELQEWQNTVANRMPEHYEDDIAQESIIDRWLDDLADGSLVREARAAELEAAAERFDTRSETLLKTMQNMVGHPDTTADDVVRYGAYSAESQTTAHWLRSRAAAIRTGEA